MADMDLLKKKLAYLKSKRDTYDSLMKDISKYLAPDRGFFEGENPGQQRADRYKYLIDPSATISLGYFAAGMQGGLNSPKRPWFKLQTNDPDLNKYEPVKEYFSRVEKIVYDILASSNFYTATHNIYMEEAAFGTGCLLMEPDFEKVLRFTALTAGEYWLDIGLDGKADTMYRELYMPARNIMKRWGKDRVSDQVRMSCENKDYFKLFKIIHMIEPREERDITKIDKLNMRYSSIYFEPSARDVLSESGFEEKPIAAPRWNTVGSAVYGSGPGEMVLRQVKMLQELNITKMRVEHQNADPTLIGPESLRKKGMNTLPGGKNYADTDKLAQFGRLFNVAYDPTGAIEGIQDVRRIIERCLFTDLFLMLVEKDDMTATEILERKQEKLFVLGPAIEKQTDEHLDPPIHYAVAEAGRRGLLPPAPQELRDQNYEVTHISSLAQAQKLSGLDQMRAYVGVAVDLSQLGEGVMQQAADKIDVDAIMDEAADITGVAPKVNRSKDEVAGIRQGRQEQQEAIQQEEAANMQAARMKDLSGASLDGNNALVAAQEAMGG